MSDWYVLYIKHAFVQPNKLIWSLAITFEKIYQNYQAPLDAFMRN